MTALQARVIELHESGMDAGDIAKKVHLVKKEVVAIIQLHAKRPGLMHGMRGMRELAREAGLIL